MQLKNKIPHFGCELTRVSHPHFGCITVIEDGICRAIHQIKNVDEFYRALGYTDHMRRCRLSPDEFVWFEYRKDHAIKSEACLQAIIIEYLNKHSKAFRDKYGSQYAAWAGTCTSEKLRDNADCTACRMHPGNSDNEHNYLMHIAELAFTTSKPLTPAQERFNMLKQQKRRS